MSTDVAKVDIAEVEQTLRQAAVLVVDPRLLRRVIKIHRSVSGLVPHGRCYVIGREALSEIVSDDELPTKGSQLPAQVILVARPSMRELAGRDRREVATRLWRTVFHARVHLALQNRVAAGELGEIDVRRRIDRIGQTEFDEIRAILRHDGLVMPPADDREVYIEFCALYLELRYFAPGLLVTTFPGVVEHERVAATLASDVDVAPLLEEHRPPEVGPLASTRHLDGTSMPSFSAPPQFAAGDSSQQKPVSTKAHGRLLRRASKARTRGNDVRAALLCARASSAADQQLRKQAEKAMREALVGLGKRLNEALGSATDSNDRVLEWSSLLRILADRAASERVLGYAVEARLLYELQRAAVAWERVQGTVDVASWIVSRGKKKVVRSLPATRELRVARYFAATGAKLRHVRIGGPDRKLLAKLLTQAQRRADKKVRVALKPRIDAALDEVKLLAMSGPERLARDKVVEELLDQIIDAGYLSFDGVRDALSRNMLKLDDLAGVGELWSGDVLLEMDRKLAQVLDGIYRRSDIYLRGLQKVSSVPFGTSVGRALTLYAVLPLGVSFVVLEGSGLVVSQALEVFGLPAFDALTPTSFIVTALLVFALIHSAPFRAFARQALDVVALVLATVLIRVPREILRRPTVRRWLARPGVRFAMRRVITPGVIGGVVYLFGPADAHGWWAPLAIAIAAFFAGTLVMGSRIGGWLEDFVVDEVAPTWHVLSRQWLPGLLQLIMRSFAALMDLLLRGIYGVDELLRYREGQNVAMKLLKGTIGFVWSIIAYAVRLYITLLVEPMINPVKHFPTVTVADKFMLPMMPGMIEAMSGWLAPLGGVVAKTFSGLTVFLLPSVFGFLAWELKENYRLYRATRPERMPPAPVGPHGETMRSLLVVGLHSGTLPKLYERLRRAAQREDDTGVISLRKPRHDALVPAGGLGKFRAGIRKVEQGLRRFVERELLALLHNCARWPHGEILIDRIDLSSNCIRIQLACPALDGGPCAITIEEQSGFVVSGIVEAGFIRALQQRSSVATQLFYNALAGFYQRAQVDLVREQIEAELGAAAHYDISDEGLIVWLGTDYQTELLYRLDGAAKSPDVRGAQPDVPPRVLEPRRLFFREQSISWVAWVAAWSVAEHPTAAVPCLLRGVSLLPEATA